MSSLDLALVIAQAFIFLLFAFASVAKVRHSLLIRQSVIEFGVPLEWASSVATAIPCIEIAIAILIAYPHTTWLGAGVAVTLLCIFSFAIVFSLLRGRRPACHCFGANSSGTVSWMTVGRNAVFIAVSSFLFVEGQKQHTAWINLANYVTASSHLSSFILALLGIVVAAESLVLLHLMKNYGSLLNMMDSAGIRSTEPSRLYPVGSTLPDFRIQSVGRQGTSSESSLWQVLQDDVPALLVFADLACKPCEALLADISSLQRDKLLTVRLFVVSSDSPEEIRKGLLSLGIQGFIAIRGEAVREEFEIKVSPTAVFVGARATVLSDFAPGAVASRRLIRDFVERASANALERAQLPANQDLLFKEF